MDLAENYPKMRGDKYLYRTMKGKHVPWIFREALSPRNMQRSSEILPILFSQREETKPLNNTNTHTNKQASKQTSKQASKQTNKQWSIMNQSFSIISSHETLRDQLT